MEGNDVADCGTEKGFLEEWMSPRAWTKVKGAQEGSEGQRERFGKSLPRDQCMKRV